MDLGNQPVMIPVPCGKCRGSMVKVRRNLVLCSKCHRPEVVKVLTPKIEAMPGAHMVHLWNKAKLGSHPFFQIAALTSRFKRRIKALGLTHKLRDYA